jgi:hypothetical protein
MRILCPDHISIASSEPQEPVVGRCEIMNKSRRAVEVIEIYSTCSCAGAGVSKAIISPSGSSELVVKIGASPNRFKGASVTIVFHFVGESEIVRRTISVRAAGET